MRLLFWVCAFGVVYSYAIYPLVLSLLIPRRRAQIVSGPFNPKVTLVVACRNEERRLRQKIENALQVSYPLGEILVASDASDDGSDAIALSYASQGVGLVRSEERNGKEHAQGLAIARALGDIIVFSDAGTDLPPESIGWMVERFRDPAVGAVSSEDLFVTADGKVAGEGAYVKYEMWLRRLESDRAGLVGLSGSFFAVRRSILTSWDASIPSDFACALKSVQAGAIAVTDSRVRGVYKDIKDAKKEYQRKVRTAVRGMTGLAREARVLNPFRFGAFSFQVWSHKVMRWMVPWFLLGLLIASCVLIEDSPVYALAFYAQLIGYALVLLAHLFSGLRQTSIARIAYYFVQANLALAHAALLFLSGRRIVVWNPSIR
jgi:cellulose synthase/poly-beta-1,6-N-acetylglucosamine synthase-like glycosyltransferase